MNIRKKCNDPIKEVFEWLRESFAFPEAKLQEETGKWPPLIEETLIRISEWFEAYLIYVFGF